MLTVWGHRNCPEVAVIGVRPLFQAKPAKALEIGAEGSNLFDRLFGLCQRFPTPLTGSAPPVSAPGRLPALAESANAPSTG